MPKIDELLRGTKKKFIKSTYRPWNYMEEIEKESQLNSMEIKQSSIGNQLEINRQLNNSGIDNTLKASEIEQEKSSHTVIKVGQSNKITTKNEVNQNIEPLAINDSETALEVIFRLSGHQKMIFTCIVERCMSRGLLHTGAIKGEMLATLCSTTLKMVKTSIQRLMAKSLIERGKGKTGRGGFYTFKISELIRNAALDYQRMNQVGYQLEINKEPIRNHENSLSANSSTSKHQGKVALLQAWSQIDFESLKEIGFSETQLLQLQDKNSPELVQESINHYAFGLANLEKYKKYNDPLNVLMGVLRKGQAWIESNYRSPQEIAMEQILQQRSLQRERENKLKDELMKAEFEDWFESLGSEEKKAIASNFNIPPSMLNMKSDVVVRSKYLDYFKEHIMKKLVVE